MKFGSLERKLPRLGKDIFLIFWHWRHFRAISLWKKQGPFHPWSFWWGLKWAYCTYCMCKGALGPWRPLCSSFSTYHQTVGSQVGRGRPSREKRLIILFTYSVSYSTVIYTLRDSQLVLYIFWKKRLFSPFPVPGNPISEKSFFSFLARLWNIFIISLPPPKDCRV